MVEKIVITGAGGFGREVLQLIDCNLFNPVGFIDPDASQSSNLSLPILGDDSLIPLLKEKNIASSICLAIGDMGIREKIFDIALKYNLQVPHIIHPSAVMAGVKTIGSGAIIYPHVVATDNCQIGRGVLLNSGVTLGHDVEIGDFSNINPGVNIAGRVKIGKKVMIGIGTVIKENVKIGDGAVIGAGSVVLKDIEKGKLAFGVPAKVQG